MTKTETGDYIFFLYNIVPLNLPIIQVNRDDVYAAAIGLMQPQCAREAFRHTACFFQFSSDNPASIN